MLLWQLAEMNNNNTFLMVFILVSVLVNNPFLSVLKISLKF